MKKKILFFHFDLGGGGAEKVLVNLLNNLDPNKYEITLFLLFKNGIYIKDLNKNIRLKYLFNRRPFRGLAQILKLFSPRLLHRFLIREKYDIEIAFLHRLPLRIISGSPVKSKYAWVHTRITSREGYFSCFRSMREAEKCYLSFKKVAFVSVSAKESFLKVTGWNRMKCMVVHNVVDSKDIIKRSQERIDFHINKNEVNICSVGRLTAIKGFDRLIRCLKNLIENGYNNWHLYLMGKGEEEDSLKTMVHDFNLNQKVSFMGFSSNPYKIVSKMDLFVCSSYDEGYSTAVTEAIILGVPVLTTDCSGMKEILDESSGIITDNNENDLYNGLQLLVTDTNVLKDLKIGAMSRSSYFSMENQLKEFEKFIN